MIKLKKTIPALPVISIKKAIVFYENKLGFKARHVEDTFAIVTRDGIEIHLWAACDHRWKFRWITGLFKPIRSGAESFLPGTASCRIEVEGIEDLYLEYKATGVIYDKNTVVTHQYWGQLDFPILDLHGNLITFFQEA